MPHIHEKIDYAGDVLIVNGDAVLLRMHDKYDMWLPPGGHVELDEDFVEAAIREAKEEAGVDIKKQDLTFVHIVHRHSEDDNVIMDWIDVYFEAKEWLGEPYNAEEEKCERLDWQELNNLPEKPDSIHKIEVVNILHKQQLK